MTNQCTTPGCKDVVWNWTNFCFEHAKFPAKLRFDKVNHYLDSYQIQIVESGSGDSFNLSEGPVTLRKADELVKTLDKSFEQWEKEGFPELPKSSLLNHYEGCNVIAICDDKTTFLMLESEGKWAVY